MKAINAALATALMMLVVAAGLALGQGERLPSPHFQGKELPEPPKQKQPWTPPQSKLPNTLLTATTALFQAGLADPRGCEYCAIKVAAGDCWSGDAGLAETHGWVLPGAKEDKHRFAVCWNGLVYPVLSMGNRADVQADIKAVIKADETQRADSKKGLYRFRHAWAERHSISHQSLLPLKACLLLRLGQEALAQGVWTAWTAGMNEKTNDDAVHLRDPYLMLATDWIWARFDRAICAHMRGDDRLAVIDARALVQIHKLAEAEADKRKFKRQVDFINEQKQPLPFFGFLSQLPHLLADQERRAAVDKDAKARAKGDQAQRIAGLIRDLENVDARQSGQPGGVDLGGDGRVKALIHEGEPAVEALLRCLEEDDRLTRSVHFWRDFGRSRTVLGVHEAAYVALSGILQVSFFGTASTGDDLTARGTEGRKKVAGSIRAYWDRFKNVPLEERWYFLLADDDLPPATWLQAAGNITRPVDVSVSPSSMYGAGWVTVPDRKPGEKPALRGEVLRKKKDPSVAELLIKRSAALQKSGAPGTLRRVGLESACQMGYHLAEWDAQAAQPVLADLVKVCRDSLANPSQLDGNAVSSLGRAIARLTQLRVQGGQKAALDDYAAWLRTVNPRALSHSWCDHLEPMWENPDHPAIAKAAEAMFTNEKSPWTANFLRAFNTHDLFRTPIVGVAGFRQRLLVELTDSRPAGKLKLQEGGHGTLELTGSWSGGPAIQFPGDPLAPKAGTEVFFRVCDYYAWNLSWLEGAPRCELYWPTAQRDRAVAACVNFLKTYGERFKFSAQVRDLQEWPHEDQARMTFPRLDHPATPDDVQKGLAIFLLPGAQKTVRPYALPAYPMKAKWVTLKDFPYTAQVPDPSQKDGGTRTEYHQDGVVWQAEEVLKDGKWERYYGFVGHYLMAKVPAAQVEFPAPGRGWAELANGIDCLLSDPGILLKDNGVGPSAATIAGLGDPLILRVKLRNRSGLEQTVPGEFVRKDPKAGLALHERIRLQLQYTPKNLDSATAHVQANWEELKPKIVAHFKAAPAAKPAAPGQEFAEFQLDLGDWFNMTRPGSYRLQLIFTSAAGGFAGGSSQPVEFSLAKKSGGKLP